jgi:hypothetical protein
MPRVPLALLPAPQSKWLSPATIGVQGDVPRGTSRAQAGSRQERRRAYAALTPAAGRAARAATAAEAAAWGHDT